MRAVITGGAGFLGSHLCDYLIERGWDVLSIDNLVTGSEANVAHLIKQSAFSHDAPRHFTLYRGGGPGRLRSQFCFPGQSGRLLETSNPNTQGGRARARTIPWAWLWRRRRSIFWLPPRSAMAIRTSASAGKLLGKREPDRSARRLRRSQAICRSDGDGLSPLPWRGYPHRAHLQYLRSAHAPE